MDAATERPTLISNTNKMRDSWIWGKERNFPAQPQFRSLPRAGETREILKTRLARGLPLGRAKRDVISYSPCTDDLHMYKVTITILKQCSQAVNNS